MSRVRRRVNRGVGVVGGVEKKIGLYASSTK
jgi:hypothetical protein